MSCKCGYIGCRTDERNQSRKDVHCLFFICYNGILLREELDLSSFCCRHVIPIGPVASTSFPLKERTS